MKRQEVIGNTYGRLTVINELEKKGIYRRVLVVCSCNLKTQKVVYLNGLRSKSTTSCGCIQKEATSAAKKIHGLRNHELYSTWWNMNERCKNPKVKQYPDYGGRGIKVCKEWQKIENFINDMWPTYLKGLSVERIDNNKGYSPENCRWATKFDQSRNMRSNRNLTFNGKTQCVTDWCKELGLNYTTVIKRMNAGKTPEQCLKMKGMMK